MTVVELRAHIEGALASTPFAPPVSVPYCTALRDALRARLPTATLDVYHRLTSLVVEARQGSAVCRVELPLG